MKKRWIGLMLCCAPFVPGAQGAVELVPQAWAGRCRPVEVDGVEGWKSEPWTQQTSVRYFYFGIQDSLRGFYLSGDGRAFVEANAWIEGQTVSLSAPGVNYPVAVRYGAEADMGRETLDVNLGNQEGLPASPFTVSVPTRAGLIHRYRFDGTAEDAIGGLHLLFSDDLTALDGMGWTMRRGEVTHEQGMNRWTASEVRETDRGFYLLSVRDLSD